MAAAEVDECMKRLVAHKGVLSVVIVNYEGIPIRTFPATMNHTDAVCLSAVFMPLFTQAGKMVKMLDSTNEFTAMRIRSQKNEFILYPEKDYLLVVCQSANAAGL